MLAARRLFPNKPLALVGDSRYSIAITYLLVLAAAFTLVGLSRHHQDMVTFLGCVAHRGLQSRRRCIYWLCSSSRSIRSSHPPFWP